MTTVIHVNESDFKEKVLNSEKPVLVDFWATWCGPCKAIAPILDQLAEERKDVIIAKVDVDNNPELAKKYGIRGIPTMNLFKDGEVEATKVGAVSKTQITAWLDAVV